MSEICPKCGAGLSWLSGASAHPDNLYCESCDYKAWEKPHPVESEVMKIYTESDMQAPGS